MGISLKSTIQIQTLLQPGNVSKIFLEPQKRLIGTWSENKARLPLRLSAIATQYAYKNTKYCSICELRAKFANAVSRVVSISQAMSKISKRLTLDMQQIRLTSDLPVQCAPNFPKLTIFRVRCHHRLHFYA